MAVAPTPPTKPTPPTAPTMNPVTSGVPSEAHSASPSNPISGSQVKPASVVQPPSTPKASDNTKAALPASFDTQEETSVKTSVPAKNQVVDNKPLSLGYSWFLAVVVIVAAVLMGLRLLKKRQKQSRTVIDYSNRTTTVNAKDGIDVMISSQTSAPKVKSNFELRV